ncbi:MAG: hypothetical protein F6J93_02995 [Oscillatoria sp. SIO1A7]|nr:hypothetical protein [Oscillatoria sp. SIO1A7]
MKMTQLRGWVFPPKAFNFCAPPPNCRRTPDRRGDRSNIAVSGQRSAYARSAERSSYVCMSIADRALASFELSNTKHA